MSGRCIVRFDQPLSRCPGSAVVTGRQDSSVEAESAARSDEEAGPALLLRGGFGGLLMGLANLVPGISGGTMLLAAGVYKGFVDGIANGVSHGWNFGHESEKIEPTSARVTVHRIPISGIRRGDP